MSCAELRGQIEALLFASGDPLSAVKLSAILDLPCEQVLFAITELNRDMEKADRGLTIVEVAGGYQLCTKPQLIHTVEKLAGVHESRLSAAAMETLAIVAFRQPVTKLEIETIRGVKADRVVSTLMERGLICETGRKEALGRPILYGTTDEFLKCFGLKHLEELPNLTEFDLSRQP